jgi:hypothetical protein
VKGELAPCGNAGSLFNLSDLHVTATKAKCAALEVAIGVELLIARHGPIVLGTVRRLVDNAHDFEDVFQAVFLSLARLAKTICGLRFKCTATRFVPNHRPRGCGRPGEREASVGPTVAG